MNISKIDGDIVYELAMQKSFFFDFNIENLGHNKRESESLFEYIKRVWNDDYHSVSKDYAVAEFVPCNIKNTNALMEVSD